MADPRTSRFWLASIQSGLLDTGRLTACWEGIPPDKREILEHLDRRLARQAVQQNYLTLWQAQQLLAGRTSGFQVDRYLLLDLIGHGGMGRVYLARDTRLSRLVALKILAPERMSNPRAIARFQREARVGAQLQHENLVRIYDFGESNGRFFLVMEYIEGKTIGALINQDGPISPQVAAQLARQIALGLEHAHRKGLIHRDVNPYNVLVTHDGIAKLADLGLAIDLAEEGRVTREGATVGTFDYVAPEQARHSHAADIRSDIYSLGCTLYHMIAGQVPFPGPSLPEKLFAHQALEPTPLRQIIPDVPMELAEIVQRMMRKQPEQRYSTPLQVAQALEPFIEEQIRPLVNGPSAEVRVHEQPRRSDDGASTSDSRRDSEEMSPSVLEPPVPGFAGHSLEGRSEPLLTDANGSASSTPFEVADVAGNPEANSSASLGTPLHVDETNNHELFPLFLDLGHEPSLSESLARSKPRGEVQASQQTGRKWILSSRDQFHQLIAPIRGSFPARRSAWTIGITIAILSTTILMGTYLWVQRRGRNQESSSSSGRKTLRNSTTDLKQPPGHRNHGTPGLGDQNGESKSPIRVVDRDGEAVPASNLAEALKMANGAHGWVELQNREPLTVSVISEQMASATNGSFRIRAMKGLRAVLSVEMKEQKPFLTIGSGTNLEVEGLVFVIHYLDRSPKAATPPVLKSAGNAHFRNCQFLLKDNLWIAGSQAIVSEGGNLTVENCSFQGLDTAIEVRASGGSLTELRNTMIISPGNRTSATRESGESRPCGWGIKMVRYAGGHASDRRLVLDHCTVAGEGLLQVDGFSPGYPLQVDISDCALQSRTLIGWVPDTAETKWNSQTVTWLGMGNQFDITESSWVMRVGKRDARSDPEKIGRDRWLKLMKEHNLIPGPVEFVGWPETHPDSMNPVDFDVKQTTQRKIGANSELMGSKPESRTAH